MRRHIEAVEADRCFPYTCNWDSPKYSYDMDYFAVQSLNRFSKREVELVSYTKSQTYLGTVLSPETAYQIAINLLKSVYADNLGEHDLAVITSDLLSKRP